MLIRELGERLAEEGTPSLAEPWRTSRVWVREAGKGMTRGWIGRSQRQEVGKRKAKFRELSKGDRRRQRCGERQAGGAERHGVRRAAPTSVCRQQGAVGSEGL